MRISLLQISQSLIPLIFQVPSYSSLIIKKKKKGFLSSLCQAAGWSQQKGNFLKCGTKTPHGDT